MDDDIVERLRSADYEYEDAELAFDAADEIERHVRTVARYMATVSQMVHQLADKDAEIERLRVAGDALAEALSAWIDGMDAFEGDQDRLRAWREARRG